MSIANDINSILRAVVKRVSSATSGFALTVAREIPLACDPLGDSSDI
jgi:hypothetical protein